MEDFSKTIASVRLNSNLNVFDFIIPYSILIILIL